MRGAPIRREGGTVGHVAQRCKSAHCSGLAGPVPITSVAPYGLWRLRVGHLPHNPSLPRSRLHASPQPHRARPSVATGTRSDQVHTQYLSQLKSHIEAGCGNPSSDGVGQLADASCADGAVLGSEDHEPPKGVDQSGPRPLPFPIAGKDCRVGKPGAGKQPSQRSKTGRKTPTRGSICRR
jgi:hypothetical protein